MKKVIHFGAGNIGRGFIGALFSQSGYHVTFVDIAEDVIKKLNERGHYKVKTAADPEETIEIDHVSGLNNMTQENDVIKAIGDATYITTAIGPNILPRIAPLIAKGLAERVIKNDKKIYVIACENQISATDILKEHIYQAVDEGTKNKMEGRVHFFNSAVDRIVPIQDNKGSLDVLVEDYYEWIVETSENIPQVEGMTTVSDLAPFIERKLFTVNTGHAVTAYFGFLGGKETIDQALQDATIYKMVKETIEETGAYLVTRYGLNAAEHVTYIEKILGRFQNAYLNDNVTRVGRSPLRKLGPEDRLIKPAREAEKLGLSYTNLAKGIAACLLFDVKEDPESVELQKMIQENGAPYVLETVSKLAANDDVTKAVIQQYQGLKGRLV